MSPIIGELVPDDLDPAVKAMVERSMGPATRGGRALSLSGAFSVDGAWNRRDVHAAEIPAANAITNAASLAKIYAATLAPVDGVQLLDAATANRLAPGHAGGRAGPLPDGGDDVRAGVHGPRAVHGVRRTGQLRPPRRRRLGGVRPARAGASGSPT